MRASLLGWHRRLPTAVYPRRHFVGGRAIHATDGAEVMAVSVPGGGTDLCEVCVKEQGKVSLGNRCVVGE